MTPRLLADLVMIVHFAFIAFVVFGGLLVLWRPRLALLHLPAVIWGIGIELVAGVCPLTPIEQRLRGAAGDGFDASFVEHYLAPLIYPAGLTRDMQFALAAAVLAINGAVYGVLYLRTRRRRSPTSTRA